MTGKRFILKSDYDWWGVVDITGEIKGEYNECFSTDTVVDLLNALHEENRELKRELGLVLEFFRNKNFTVDDFNEWLVNEKWNQDKLRMSFEAKEALRERFGDD